MPRHKQVRVKYGKLDENIDELIAPLILEMWRAGIKTNMSCQSNWHRKVWIEFPDTREAAKFLNIVSHPFDPRLDSLNNRMDEYWAVSNIKEWTSKWWEFETFAHDASIERGETWEEDVRFAPPYWYFTISIRFPKSDLAVIVERLQQNNILKNRTGGKIFAAGKNMVEKSGPR